MVLRRPNLLAYDWGLILLALAISVLGLFNLRSAAPDPGLLNRQLVAFLLGLLLAVGVQFLSRRTVFALAYPLYALSLLLLVAVLAFGREINGAKAWFVLGPLQFQPLELAKLGLILALARLLEAREVRRVWDYLLPGFLTAPVVLLLLLQPDLGGGLVVLFGVFSVLFVRGLPWKHLVVGFLALALLVPTVVWPNLKPYQRERVLIVLDPYRDPLGQGFQVIQSTIAIGSGGLFGKGYGQGTQTQLGFVPFRHTDFVFAVFAEEWGFVGAVALIGLYALLLARLLGMALECPRPSDRLFLAGVGGMLGFQVLVNLGVALGVMPVTGLTLPLFSYGGSSLMATLFSLGLALLVHRDRAAP
ncbi:rod shape-determining protein RodA [Thermus neutrinimicus]|uniref:rod shape-determining protein RodA n=1 Tax=Thermus neutrinimicus TaxID=2908149 RepID=UPI001FA996A8|nr:rod shape-determining protein RodA [Thermus neutrinimicus]